MIEKKLVFFCAFIDALKKLFTNEAVFISKEYSTLFNRFGQLKNIDYFPYIYNKMLNKTQIGFLIVKFKNNNIFEKI